MPIGAAISVVGSVAGAAIQSNAAQKAAKQQAKGAAQARQDLLPFSIPGQGATASLAQLYGINPETGEADPNQAFNQSSLEAFRRSPDFQFAFQTGQDAVNTAAGGAGMLKSGNRLRDLTTFGQGLASQQFGNYRGALQQLAALGQSAATGAGNAAIQQGTAQASGTVGSANAIAGGLGNIANTAMMYQYMNRQPSLSAYSGGAMSPYNAASNPMGYSNVLPGGVGAVPY
jgi:hypothetical protein